MQIAQATRMLTNDDHHLWQIGHKINDKVQNYERVKAKEKYCGSSTQLIQVRADVSMTHARWIDGCSLKA